MASFGTRWVAQRARGMWLRGSSSMRGSSGMRVRCVRGVSTSADDEGVDVDYAHFLSDAAQRYVESPIRALMPIMKQPGMISLHGGMPHPSTFPFQGIQVSLVNGGSIHISDAEFANALQYSETPGLPPLTDRLRNMQHHVHAPPSRAADFDVLVTTGSQDAIAKAFMTLLNPGDPVLVEAPTYTGALACLQAQCVRPVGVDVDGHGLRADALATTLDEWNDATQGPKPKVLYTVPTGSNPTGATQTAERKRQVYEVCRRHNIIILEDDPYYYMQFQSPRIPSFLSMDVDGRVLRFDSTSKLLTPGLRIGWVTGPKPLVHRINLNAQSSCLHTSGLSQTVVLAYLRHLNAFETAGEPGQFEDHVDTIVDFYRHRRDVAVGLADKYLREPGYASFVTPDAGMFLWLKLAVDDADELIRDKAAAAQVLLVPGSAFFPDAAPSPFARAAFSMASLENMETAFQRLGKLMEGVVAKQ